MKATLPDSFFTTPSTAHTMMTSKELKDVLLSFNGQIIAKGTLWIIRCKHIGAGVYRVSLDQANHKEKV